MQRFRVLRVVGTITVVASRLISGHVNRGAMVSDSLGRESEVADLTYIALRADEIKRGLRIAFVELLPKWNGKAIPSPQH